jgi:hypothetical protein
VGSPDGYDPNDRRFTAIHEAGHAVTAVVLGLPLASVDICEREMSDGGVALGCSDLGILDVMDIIGKGEVAVMPHLIHSMAGAFAEEKVNPQARGRDCNDLDIKHQHRLAMYAMCNPTKVKPIFGRLLWVPGEQKRIEGPVNALKESARTAAARIVAEHWSAIEEVAARLLERERLSGAEVADIVNPGI